MKLIPKFAFLLLFTLVGCGATPDISIKYQNVSKPQLGVVTTANMGEQLFRSGRAYMANCVIPNFSTTESVNLFSKLRILANQPLCEKEFKGLFFPQYDNWLTATSSGNFPVGLKVFTEGGVDKYCSTECIERPKGSFARDRLNVFEEGAFQQVIEYMGKSGSTLEFTYSEFTNNLARDAFTRTFKIDLDEGNVIYYKGAEIEIIEAKAGVIKYKVISGFN